MKPTYITEILIIFFCAVSGAMMYINWITFIGGLIIINLVSYFLVSKLKKQTIKEYLKILNREKE